MAFDQGIDFRATAVFVTDPSGCDNEIGTTANYPRTSAQGNTVGWEDAPGGTRNRTSTIDARLAGVAFKANGTASRYRIDLPSAGYYKIVLALGDNGAAQAQSVSVWDGTTIVSNVVGQAIATASATYFDACGIRRTSAADWVTNEVSFIAHFSSTICRIKIGDGGASGNSSIAHVRVTDSVAPPPPRFNAGFDFRGSTQFVADPTNCDPIINNFADYPHITRSGLTVGWEDAISGTHDRNSAIDGRLAGVFFCLAGTQAQFRIDLPDTGAYRLEAAIGDAGGAQSPNAQTVEVFDTNTSLGTLVSGGATNGGEFYDATGVKRTSAADWVANETPVTKNFTTTVLRLKCGIAAGGSSSTTLAHVKVTQLAGLTGTSSLAVTLGRIRRFLSTLAGIGHLTATVAGLRRFTATVSGRGTLSATVTGLRRFTATLTGRGSLSATVSAGGVTRPITATLTGTSSLRAVFPVTIHDPGKWILQADDANFWPITTTLAALVWRADTPTLIPTPSSGVWLLKADAPLIAGSIQPANSGILRWLADPPTVAGTILPGSGKYAWSADSPTVYPLKLTSGKLAWAADKPTGVPIGVVSGRLIWAAASPTVYPLSIAASGRLRWLADSPTISSASVTLHQSGIYRWRADVPVVIPLNEPPPPPPPLPTTTGSHVSVTL